MHLLEKKTIIHKPLAQVFDFFSKAENLNKITPPEVYFKIVSNTPLDMKEGLEIDYNIKLMGIPFAWKSRITKWNPPFMFEDTQLKGPYRTWIHQHIFEEENGITKMTDRITYQSPGGFLEFIPHNLFVKNKVKQIFDYREKVLLDIFEV